MIEIAEIVAGVSLGAISCVTGWLSVVLFGACRRVAVLTEQVRAHEAALSAMETEQEDAQRRLLVTEERVQAMNVRGEIGIIHGRIDDVSGAVRRMEGELSGISHAVNLIHAHLLEGGNR